MVPSARSVLHAISSSSLNITVDLSGFVLDPVVWGIISPIVGGGGEIQFPSLVPDSGQLLEPGIVYHIVGMIFNELGVLSALDLIYTP